MNTVFCACIRRFVFLYSKWAVGLHFLHNTLECGGVVIYVICKKISMEMPLVPFDSLDVYTATLNLRDRVCVDL